MGHRPQLDGLARNGVRVALALGLLALAGTSLPRAQTAAQGILPEEVVVGTHLDLSGPLSLWGESVRNGLTMAIKEANQAGGINGRKIRLIVRDDSYDPDRAADAVRTLVNQDHVFAILSPLGAPTAKAAMGEALSRGVLYLFPMAASEDVYLPPDPLKFVLAPSYAVEVQEGLRRLLNARSSVKVGLLASDDEFGREVRRGVEAELERRGKSLAAEATFPSDETQFDSHLDELRMQGTDIVVLGTEAAQALAVARTARAMRWRPAFLCSSACYAAEFATLAGVDAEGLYGVGQVAIPYDDDPKLGAWARRYEMEFSSVANVQALAAYRAAHLFLAVLRQAGPMPTQASFARLLETRGAWTDPNLGGLPIEFTSADHLGSHGSLLAQIRRGRWTVLADPLPDIRQ